MLDITLGEFWVKNIMSILCFELPFECVPLHFSWWYWFIANLPFTLKLLQLLNHYLKLLLLHLNFNRRFLIEVLKFKCEVIIGKYLQMLASKRLVNHLRRSAKGSLKVWSRKQTLPAHGLHLLLNRAITILFQPKFTWPLKLIHSQTCQRWKT